MKMYTRVQFGKELKERIAQKQDVEKIGNWVYQVYLSEDVDSDFDGLLLALSTMCKRLG